MGDHDDEVSRLRRAAFSRTGTPDDLQRLAALEDSTVAPEAPVSQPPAEIVEALPETSPDEPDPSRQPQRRTGVALVAGAAGGALLATVIGLVIANAMAPPSGPTWSGESSLSVFDREATAADDPARLAVPIEDIAANPGRVGEIELRWIGAPGGFDVYAARWTQPDPTVCLIVESSLQAEVRCSSEQAFRNVGIRIQAFGLDLRWGPNGTELWANSSG